MAEAKVSEDLDRFSCFICSNLLRDPVSVPCGHSFCMTCINTHWSIDFCRGLYICPVCKQRFYPRPILGQNLMLTEMVEWLKKVRAPEGTLTGPEYVECDICTGRKHKAVKSCLDCVASYCEVHFNLHNVVNSNSTHKVTETRYDLRKRICSRHNKLQNVLCCTEERAVCIKCAVSECSGHKTIAFATKRAQQQLEIQMIQSQVQGRTEAALSSMTDLKKAIQSIKSSAETTLNQSEKILVELINSAERKRLEIREVIKATEEAEVQRADEILKRMEQEVTKLRERDNELVQLAHLDDDFLFILHYTSLLDFSTFDDVAHVAVNQSPFKEIQNSVAELEIKVKDFYRAGSGNGPHMDFTSVPIIREEFLQHFHQMTVDPTASDSDLSLLRTTEK